MLDLWIFGDSRDGDESGLGGITCISNARVNTDVFTDQSFVDQAGMFRVPVVYARKNSSSIAFELELLDIFANKIYANVCKGLKATATTCLHADSSFLLIGLIDLITLS